MSDNREIHWKGLYHAALVEVDRAKLGERIDEAANAVRARLMDLETTPDLEEKGALHDALFGLQTLRRELK